MGALMDKHSALAMFESLASGMRLDAYRLLVRHHPDGLVAGAIASELQCPATTLSFHLKAMNHAGLVTVVQEGRFLRYRANLPRMQAMVAFLTEECCGGEPEKCREGVAVCAVDDTEKPAQPANMAVARTTEKARR